VRGKQKIYISLFVTIGGTFIPDWPNLSIYSLDEGWPGSVPAPTRFSEAHAAPDIAGIMEQAENGDCGEERETCAGKFSSKTSTDLEPVFSTCSRNMIGTRPHLWRFTMHCTYMILRWLGLLFSNFRTGKTSKIISAGIRNFSTGTWSEVLRRKKRRRKD